VEQVVAGPPQKKKNFHESKKGLRNMTVGGGRRTNRGEEAKTISREGRRVGGSTGREVRMDKKKKGGTQIYTQDQSPDDGGCEQKGEKGG